MLGANPINDAVEPDVTELTVPHGEKMPLALFLTLDVVGGKPGPWVMYYHLVAPNGSEVIPWAIANQVWDGDMKETAHVVVRGEYRFAGDGVYRFGVESGGETFELRLTIRSVPQSA